MEEQRQMKNTVYTLREDSKTKNMRITDLLTRIQLLLQNKNDQKVLDYWELYIAENENRIS